MVSCNFLNGQPAESTFPLIRQKTFLKKTRKGEWPLTSPTEGGSGGASPPAFTRTTGTSKSPSEAVFILLEVTPKARQPLFFWRLLLKPGSPYSFGGTPKARQPLLSCPSVRSSVITGGTCPSRSHVHTSGTKPAIFCLMWFLVISLTVNPLKVLSR